MLSTIILWDSMELPMLIPVQVVIHCRLAMPGYITPSAVET